MQSGMNVELCLRFPCGSLLVCGWAYSISEATDDLGFARIGHDGNLIIEFSKWYPRRDVVDAFRLRKMSVNQNCGYVAIFPGDLTKPEAHQDIVLITHTTVLATVEITAVTDVDDLSASQIEYLAAITEPLLAISEHFPVGSDLAHRIISILGAVAPDVIDSWVHHHQSPSASQLSLSECKLLESGLLVIAGSCDRAPCTVDATIKIIHGHQVLKAELLWIPNTSQGTRSKFVAFSQKAQLPHNYMRAMLELDFGGQYAYGFIDISRCDIDNFLEGQLAASASVLTVIQAAVPPGTNEAHRITAHISDTLKHCPSYFEGFQGDAKSALDQCITTATGYSILTGWVVDTSGALKIEIVARDGSRFPLLANALKMPRPDVLNGLSAEQRSKTPERCGFLAVIPSPKNGNSSMTEHAIVQDNAGLTAILRPLNTKVLSSDPNKAISELINLAAASGTADVFSLLGPVVQSVWSQRLQAPAGGRISQFGPAPAAPEVSVIVPIFGRYDFIEHQLSHFASDTAMRAAELIYLVDDPRLCDSVRKHARIWWELYRTPFTVVEHDTNQGYAGANNTGARLARGRMLLLLNSDVMPKRHGWLADMLEIFAELPDAGVLTPRLLYPDGSIQYAGMQFRLDPWVAPYYLNTHPFKGLPTSADRNTGPVEVPAGTGACMLIPADLYRKLGGLDESFISGDYEDSNLCLEVRAAGLRVWYDPRVELYHLERQSIPALGAPSWRQYLTFYNAWLHTSRWGDTIANLLAEEWELVA